MSKNLKERLRKTRKEEQGAVMLLVALMLVILLGAAALAIDYGLIYIRAAQFQRALDISARAASRAMLKDDTLDYNDQDTMDKMANQVVKEYMKKNGFEYSSGKCVFKAKASTPIKNESGGYNFTVNVDGTITCGLKFGRLLVNKDNIDVDANGAAETELMQKTGKKLVVDVVFVLDISGSMYVDYNKGKSLVNDKLGAMVMNVNKAIDDILTYNADNRVGVVVFSGSDHTTEIINLKKKEDIGTPQNNPNSNYTSPNTGWLTSTSQSGVQDYIKMKFVLNGTKTRIVISGCDGVVEQEQGGTYTQLGIYKGSRILEEAKLADDDDYDRTPAMFVMSDGEATYGNTDYKYVGDDPPENVDVGQRYPVIIYGDKDYGGKAVGLSCSGRYANYRLTGLQAAGAYNDWMSSIKISDGYKVELYWDDSFTSTKTTLTSSSSYVGDRWNDQVSAIKIYKTDSSASGSLSTSAGQVIGSGSATNTNVDILGRIGAMTVLTAWYWKQQIIAHYNEMNAANVSSDELTEVDDTEGVSALWYSLAFSLQTNTYPDFAERVLNPVKDEIYYNPKDTPTRYMAQYLKNSGVNWDNPYDKAYVVTDKSQMEDALQAFARDVVIPETRYSTWLVE